jgi:aerobic-type carbon monoxide dehydrogenase small subunit (CoxS/CutS family)
MIMTAAALLDSKATLSKKEVKSAMSGNLCRCGAHPRILAAILQAVEETS